MISVAFVGLVLTTAPHLLRVFGRPLRADVPLASHFPAWIDAGYGPVSFPSDEVVAGVAETVDDSPGGTNDVSSARVSPRVPVSLSLPSALKDAVLDKLVGELEDVDEFNSLEARRSMDDLLVYRPDAEPLVDEEDDAEVTVTEEKIVFPFAGLDKVDVSEPLKVNTEHKPVLTSPVSETGLRADAPEFKLPSRLVEVAPAIATGPSTLRADVPVFTPRRLARPAPAVSSVVSPSVLRADVPAFAPRGSPASAPAVIQPVSPLRKDAPAFKPRSALVRAIACSEPRPASGADTTRDALSLACASRVGFVTPKHVLTLEAPRRRRRRRRAAPAAPAAIEAVEAAA